MEDLNRDVLGVSVSPEGLARLRRLASGVKWTLFLAALAYFPEVHPFDYVVFLGMLNFFQLWLLLRFSRQSTVSCQVADSQGFNESLTILTRPIRMAQITFILGLVFGSIELWSSSIFYSTIH